MSSSSSTINRNIWNPEIDYINGRSCNYLQRLKDKIISIHLQIKYTKSCIDNPEYSKAAKELIFIPTLQRELRTLKIYEKQASLLAA